VPSAAPLLTVICNVHNDAERLPRAVGSALAACDGPDVEVLVVDDGSTDDTGAVADRLAAEDERVRVVHRGVNDGAPGAPRNLGLDEARGDWVAFVDSDDTYVAGSLRRLLEAAVAQEADVAAGAVARYNERTDRLTPLPATGYTTGPVEPLSAGSPLWQDTIAVAKVIRRALLDEHAIRFPEGILYEDQPFTVALWSTARRITTLDEVVYHWYVNNVAGEESITARRHEIANVHDRLAANRAIDVQLNRRPDLAPAKLDKFVRHDLSLYGKDLDARDADYRGAFLAAVRDYLTELPAELREGLDQPYRLAVRELVDGSTDSAVAACLFAYRRLHVDRPLVQRADRWWWPYRPAGEASADHDLTAVVATEHARRRRIWTTTCRKVWVEQGTLHVAGTVVDGDDGIGARARLTVSLVDRDTSARLSSDVARLRPDGAFDAALELPSPGAAATPATATATAWDVRVDVVGALRSRLPVRTRKPHPVELPTTVALPSLDGIEVYRTRNGNLSLRPSGDVASPPGAAG